MRSTRIKRCALYAAFGAALIFPCGGIRAQDDKSVHEIQRGVDAVDASVHAGVDDRASLAPQPDQAPPAKAPATYSHWGFNNSSGVSGNAPANASAKKSGDETGNISSPESGSGAGSGARFGQFPATQKFGTSNIGDAAQVAPEKDEPEEDFRPSFQAGARKSPDASVWSIRPSDPSATVAGDLNSQKPGTQPDLFPSFDAGRKTEFSAGTERAKTVVPTPPSPQPDGFSSPFHESPFGPASDTFSRASLFSVPAYSPRQERTAASKSKIKSHAKTSLDTKHAPAAVGLSNGREKPRRSLQATKANQN